MKTATIYTTPTCHFCHGAKEFFKEHNVAFTEKDVTKDMAARDEMISKSHQMGVPVIFVGDEIIIGFDEDALRKSLDIKN